MTFAPAALPSDPDELRAFAARLQAEGYAKTLQIDKLKAQLAALRRARFGRSSEKLDRDLGQLQLLLGEIEEGDAEATARTVKAGGEKPARHGTSATAAAGRRPPPRDLLRRGLVHEPPAGCPARGRGD